MSLLRKEDLLLNFIKENEVAVFALGGLGEVGKNMYCIEYQNEIIVIDSGILFPDERLLGIDYVINDYTYLIENQDQIKALIITHGHEDHIGAIPFLLKQVNIPKIYANGIAVELIKLKLREHKGLRGNIIEFHDHEKLMLGKMNVSFFRTNHSIPDSFGLVIQTPEGNIVHTGDFKFDFTPTGQDADYQKIAEVGKKGVLLLLSDSTNSEVPGFTKSEQVVANSLNHIFSTITGRAIVATFASNVHRIQQIVDASVKQGRKIAVFGRSMIKTIDVGQDLGYIKAPKGTFLDSNGVNKLTASEVTILCTGSQGEPMAALSRIANGTHRQISLVEGDTVIFSSSPIPGNQDSVGRTVNLLFKKGAHVITDSPLNDTHTSGHATQEEQKLMLKLVSPKFFMPMHGEYRMLKIHANTGYATGVKKGNAFVCLNGDVLAVTRNSARIAGKVPAGNIYVDGKDIGDTGKTVIRDRKLLSEDGLLSIVVTIDKAANKQLKEPNIISRGFIYMKQHGDITSEISDFVFNQVNDYLKENTLQEAQIKRILTKRVKEQINVRTERNPMIIPVIRSV
jgi:ribonuclease J